MTLLVDTHVLLWMFSDSEKLSVQARAAVVGNDLCVSIASLWELAIKASLPREEKRLILPVSISEIVAMCENQGIDILTIAPRDCERIMKLPHIHDDPFDRIILAQAINHGFPLVTRDKNLWKYDQVSTIW